MPRVELLVPLATVIAVSVAAQSIAPRSDTTAHGLKTTHTVGYYDATLQRVVLVGSAVDPQAGNRDHVWSWTGTHWEGITVEGPPARSNAAAAYDAGRGIAVVSGGARYAEDSAFVVIGDTWEGSTGGWHRFTGTDIEPRDHQAMVYDAGRAALLMFGGIPAKRSEPWPAETLELRPEGWARVATDGPAPRARTALAYDTVRRQVVLFGGVGASPGPGQDQPFLNDTWVWEENRWRKLAVEGPPARYAHGIVFDEQAGVVLLYSGAAAHRNAPLSDMWQWDGKRWTEIPLSGPTPGYRYQPVMVYDRARSRTVLYGGIEGSRDDTWEWDGRRWTLVQP